MANQPVYKTDLTGIANGIIFMAFFGTMWAIVGIIGLRELGSPWLFGIAGFIGMIFFAVGMRVFGYAKHAAVRTNAQSKARDKRMRVGFNLTFLTEIALILFAAFILRSIGLMEWFFPVMCFIVGVHFFPLAYLFREKVHYITGALLCLLASIVLFLPQNAAVGSSEITLWAVAVGFGAALILWMTAFFIWRSGLPLLKQLSK